MKKSTMVTWLTVLLYIVSALGTAALANEMEIPLDDPPSAAETVVAAPNGPEPQPTPEEQPAEQPSQEPVDPSPSGGNGSQPNGQQPAKPPVQEGESAYWQDPPDESASPDEESDPTDDSPVFSVLFISHNGDILLAFEAAAGSTIRDPHFSPTLKGHKFSHWYQVGANPYASFNFGGSLEGNLTLAAFFKQATPAKPETVDPAPGDENLGEENLDEENLNEENLNEENPGGADLPPILVTITSDADETLRLGDRVTLTAHVSGQLAGETLTLWRYSAGGNWVVAATNTQTHSFVVDENNCGWTWEFVITVIVGAAE